MLEHLRDGASNAEIADALGVSVNTIRYHVSNMLMKLGARDRVELREWDGVPHRRHGWPVTLGRLASNTAVRFGAAAATVLALAVVVSIANSQGRTGNPAPSSATVLAAGNILELDETPRPSATTSPLPAYWEQVAMELVQVCTSISEENEQIALGDHLNGVHDLSIVGAAFRVSNDGCIRHPPPIEVARQRAAVPDEDAPYVHVSCWLWPQQSEPRIDRLEVAVELFHGADSSDGSELHRIVEAPDDGIVFANCGVAVPDVNRFDNDSTQRWLPAA